MKELWSRIVFSIFISNTDDHLRNHGFLLRENGWILSPAFDINPNEDGTGLSLNISLDSNDLNPDLPMEIAPYFRLDKDEASMRMERIRESVRGWRRIAGKYKIPKSEQNIMAKAFDRFL